MAPVAQASVIPESASVVEAHCGSSTGSWYSSAYQSFANAHDAVRGKIELTQGNICGVGVSHSLTLCVSSCNKFVQVGWRYRNFMTVPMMYCEKYNAANGYNDLDDFAMSQTTHTYKFAHEFSGEWKCYRDGEVIGEYVDDFLGFTAGTYMNAQAEAHVYHAQLGRVAPNKLRFDEIHRRRDSDQTWFEPTLIVQPNIPQPYNGDVPSAGTLDVWTDASH
jgi:hypothetical protein